MQPTDAQSDRPDGAPTPLQAISSHELINFIHHHVVELITAFYLVYVILGTLLPFDFSLSARSVVEQTFWGLGTAQSSLPDVLSNLALYLPLGVLFHTVLIRRLGWPILSILLGVGAAVLLSLTIETVQMFSPTRISSAIDVGANSLGACAGVLLSAVCRGPERRLLSSLSKELAGRPLPTVVKAYAWLLILGALVPFTPTLDATRLMASVRSSTLTPFALDADLAEKANQAQVWENEHDLAAYRRDRMLLWGSWFAEALSFCMLGGLLHRLLREEVGFQPFQSVGMALYIAFWLALLMSVLQIAILTRGFHSTDIGFRVFGTLVGYAWRSLRNGVGLSSLERAGTRRWRWAVATLTVSAGLIFFTGLAPFSFDAGAEGLMARLGSAEIIPFNSYYLGRFDQVCADFWGKALRYGFLATGLWLWWPVRIGGSLRSQTATIALVALGLSVVIELAQLFILSRVPSVTDLIIAGMAGWVTPIGCQYVFDFYAHARKHHVGLTPSSAGQPRMSPADWLIASLISDVDCDSAPLPESNKPHQQA